MSEKDPWGPKATVAIILALTVLLLPVMDLVIAVGGLDYPPPEIAKVMAPLYKDLIMVLIGALSGYIAGTAGRQD